MTLSEYRLLHQRIQPYIHRTPVMTSRLLDEISGTQTFFKCENFQRMGAFKMRGATNALLNLTDEQRANGVVAHSSGNFAQAVALAAREMGIKAYIVMPNTATAVKKQAVLDYGAEVIESLPTPEDRQAHADRISQEKGVPFLHPSNNMDVILGQGTAAIELLDDYPDLEVVITPVGGGGLLAGASLAVHLMAPHAITIGGEPMEADDAYRSLKSGKIESNATANTIADGLRTHLGHHNFPIIQQHVSEIIRVTENEIIEAMRLIWERMKIVVEPSSAVAFAALLREKSRFQGKRIGMILTGGNVDVTALPFGWGENSLF